MKLNLFVTVFGRRFGFQYSPIVHQNHGPYLTRWILYLGFFCLRLHKFYRGDHDRASHNHPWWFITFPLADYLEILYRHGKPFESRVVERFKFHYRPAAFEHVVKYKVKRIEYENCFPIWVRSIESFWTIVIAGGKSQNWGFYKPDGTFIPYREYEDAED